MVDGDGMLEMGGRTAVARDYAPLIGEHIERACTQGDHGLNGEAPPILDELAVAAIAIIGHLRVFVHVATDTVTDEFAHHSIALRLTVTLYGIADVAEAMTGDGLLDAFVEGLLRGGQKLTHLVRNGTYTERVAGVSTETVELGAAVHRDDIALPKGGIVGDAVHHDLVDGGADGGGESRPVGIGEALECGLRSIIPNDLFGEDVQLTRSHPGPNGFCYLGECCADQ